MYLRGFSDSNALTVGPAALYDAADDDGGDLALTHHLELRPGTWFRSSIADMHRQIDIIIVIITVMVIAVSSSSAW